MEKLITSNELKTVILLVTLIVLATFALDISIKSCRTADASDPAFNRFDVNNLIDSQKQIAGELQGVRRALEDINRSLRSIERKMK